MAAASARELAEQYVLARDGTWGSRTKLYHGEASVYERAATGWVESTRLQVVVPRDGDYF